VKRKPVKPQSLANKANGPKKPFRNLAFKKGKKKSSSTLRIEVRSTFQFERLALIGVGLIGSSIARAVRAKGLARSIVATARSAETRQRAIELQLADQVVETNAAAVKGADLVIASIPVGTYGAVAQEIGPFLQKGAIFSDVGSVKQSVIRDVMPHLPKGVHFVPAHPVAGTEFSGPDAGFADLFIDRWCIITPTKSTDLAAIQRLSSFWRSLRAKVSRMSPEHHDKVLAITSHLPHLIAYTIVATTTELSKTNQLTRLNEVDQSFRLFTRIAASDPTMWRDIFLTNKDAVQEMLLTFNEDLAKLTRAMRDGDGKALLRHFSHVQKIRNILAHKHEILPSLDVSNAHEQHWTNQFGQLLAITSHLPHLIAYTIVGTADELRKITRSEVLKFSAGGFRDFTSIATSDPRRWRDILLNNKSAILDVLGRFNENLLKLTRAMRSQDGATLYKFFMEMREIRRSLADSDKDAFTKIDYIQSDDHKIRSLRPYASDDD
jgi:cyclohexadieny/prephenate dehydrogenase